MCGVMPPCNDVIQRPPLTYPTRCFHCLKINTHTVFHSRIRALLALSGGFSSLGVRRTLDAVRGGDHLNTPPRICVCYFSCWISVYPDPHVSRILSFAYDRTKAEREEGGLADHHKVVIRVIHGYRGGGTHWLVLRFLFVHFFAFGLLDIT